MQSTRPDEPEDVLVFVHRCRVVTFGDFMNATMEDPDVIDSLHKTKRLSGLDGDKTRLMSLYTCLLMYYADIEQNDQFLILDLLLTARLQRADQTMQAWS